MGASFRARRAGTNLPRGVATKLCNIGAAAFAAALFALSGASSVRASGFDFERPLDRGGDIGEYTRRIVSGAGRAHVISGDCMSACTMWLGHRGVCVTPDAVLWFHAATDRLQAMRQENPWRTISHAGNAALLAMYPPRVRAVVRPWLDSPDYHTLTGAQLAALGVPLCRGGAIAGREGAD